MNINAIMAVTKKTAKIVSIKLRKHAPEILMVIGVASVVGGTVQACKTTLKVKDIVEEKNELLEEINIAEEKASKLKDGTNYTPDDSKKDRRIVKLTALFNVCKAYAPAVSLILLGLSCFASSHIIMAHRFSVMCTAYSALKKNYDLLLREHFCYRNKVHSIGNGELVDSDIINAIPDDQKPRCTDKSMNGATPYVFDEACPKWSKSPWRNKMLIQGILGDLQRDLRTNGYVFLNDVNRAFKLPLTAEGQYLGWTDKVPESDEYGVISLGPDVEKFIADVDAGKWNNCSATGLLFCPNVHGNILEFV